MDHILPLAKGIPAWHANTRSLFYAGIGSRETPTTICNQMSKLAKMLEKLGYTLRSGHAPGADQAFERGTAASETYLPWARFEGSDSPLYHVTEEAFALARQFHKGWEYLSRGARLLIARDGYQVLGGDLHSPSRFVVCWTKGGQIRGGTGQALRIAEAYKIPVFNLAKITKYDVFQFARSLVPPNCQNSNFVDLVH